MAVRLATLSDAQFIRDHWDTYRAGLTEYAREQGWTLARVQEWIADPRYFIAVDPQTQTLGLFIAHPPDAAELAFMGTLTTGTLAARRAADTMFMWFLERTIERGAVRVFGDYVFPAGVNVAQTRAWRYFANLPGVTITQRVTPLGQDVLIEMLDLPASLAGIAARQ